jgi:hypothetical protein
MATSTCGHCGGTRFEVKEVVPNGLNYKLFFVQCASCGVPIGSMEYMSISTMIHTQNEAIKKIASAVGAKVDL